VRPITFAPEWIFFRAAVTAINFPYVCCAAERVIEMLPMTYGPEARGVLDEPGHIDDARQQAQWHTVAVASRGRLPTFDTNQ
jgi:hypothetical protein